jgi:hypothetical protein
MLNCIKPPSSQRRRCDDRVDVARITAALVAGELETCHMFFLDFRQRIGKDEYRHPSVVTVSVSHEKAMSISSHLPLRADLSSSGS